MTGVIAGSGGTGLREGSRPGSGSTGADIGPPTPLLIGTAQSGFAASFDTPSFTALPNRAMYIAAVVTGGSSLTPNLPSGITGMGLEWNLLTSRLYRSTGSNEGRMDTFWAYGQAINGVLTVSGQTFGRALIVFAVDAGHFPLNLVEAPLYVNPAVTATPSVEPWETAIAIHGLSEISQPTTLDPAFTPIGESPAQGNTLKVFAGFHKPTDLPANYTFQNASNTNGVDVVMLTMAALPVMPYVSTLNGMSPTARYPLGVKSTLPDIDGYDTELAKPAYGLQVLYPCEEKGTLPGGIPDYDTLVTTDLDPSFFVHPGAKGAGSDPGDYDTLVTTDLDPSFYVHPGAKGAGADPGNYDTLLATLNRARYFRLDQTAVGPALPNYDTLLATFNRGRYMPLGILTELPAALLDLNPVGYWQLRDGTATAIDLSGGGHGGTYSGDYTLQDEPGPDGLAYSHFRSDFIGPGHGARVTVPTTALDGSFSPDGHGATWVMLIKRDTPADLGYPIAKRTATSTDREYEMSYAAADWRADAFDGVLAIMNTTAPNPNATIWELIVYRCPDISFGGADPFEIFVDSGTPLTPSIAETAGIGYLATDSSLGIGGFPDTNSYGHNGGLAHVAVYDFEMSDAQITTIAAAATADGWIA